MRFINNPHDFTDLLLIDTRPHGIYFARYFQAQNGKCPFGKRKLPEISVWQKGVKAKMCHID